MVVLLFWLCGRGCWENYLTLCGLGALSPNPNAVLSEYVTFGFCNQGPKPKSSILTDTNITKYLHFFPLLYRNFADDKSLYFGLFVCVYLWSFILSARDWTAISPKTQSLHELFLCLQPYLSYTYGFSLRKVASVYDPIYVLSHSPEIEVWFVQRRHTWREGASVSHYLCFNLHVLKASEHR